MIVSGLFTYPVKSLRALSHTTIDVEARGLTGDRRWLITDAKGRFLTQREISTLAAIKVSETAQGIKLGFQSKTPINVLKPGGLERTDVKVWGDVVNAADAGDGVAAALSARLKRKVRLVYMDDNADRAADAVWAGPGQPVSFADGFPVLVTSTASLSALNRQIELEGDTSITMDRFRPNIIIENEAPWAEDAWMQVQIGEVILEAAKPCTRCIVTTTDQETGQISDCRQPLQALTALRRSADPRVKGVLFGWNMVVSRTGRITLKDKVRILKVRSETWPVAPVR